MSVKQVVHNVVPGATYHFGVWVRTWSSTGVDRAVSTNPAPIDAWICIGTHGSSDDLSDPDTNVCSAPIRPYDTWQHLSINAGAGEDQILVRVLAQHNPDEPGAVIWDDASLTTATLPATPTPGPATRPAPIPFDAGALYNAMIQARSDMEQMGGLLDRVALDGPQPCGDYLA